MQARPRVNEEAEEANVNNTRLDLRDCYINAEAIAIRATVHRQARDSPAEPPLR